jgi:predicted dithiol-disulfide oxidoreductase (DUF899 family)
MTATLVTFAVVSRVPMPRIHAFQKRIGWRFHWVSAFDTDFQRDYGVPFTKAELAGEVHYNYGKQRFGAEEEPGLSVFYKDEGAGFSIPTADAPRATGTPKP